MWSNMARSVWTLSANPWVVRPSRSAHRWRRSSSAPASPPVRLGRARPIRPGSPRASLGGRGPQGHQGIDDHLLDPARRAPVRDATGPHGHQGIADELAGAVVGDVAAPVHPDELGPDRSGVAQHMARVGVGPEREHGRMLEQQEVVGRGAAAERPLEGPCLVVGHPAEPPDSHRLSANRAGDATAARLELAGPVRSLRICDIRARNRAT